MALAFNVSYGKIKGASKDANTYYPAPWQDYSFNHALWDTGLRYEYNFWPYGTGMEYRGAKRVTPYIYIGVGMTIATPPDKTEVGMNVPIGGGVKFIPLTGVTLPFVSYGGSSVLTSILLFEVLIGVSMVQLDEKAFYEKQTKIDNKNDTGTGNESGHKKNGADTE